VADGTGDGTTLRLALGMRGGVSLAVWIGGATSELDSLRAAAHDPSSSSAGLLALGGYTGVQIDVMSGASVSDRFTTFFFSDHSRASARRKWVSAADQSQS